MFSALIVGGLTGCAMTSDVMDTGYGTYMISGHAAPIRGGATGANQVAYQDAQKFCIQQNPGFHAIVIGAEDRDVYQSSFGGSWGPKRRRLRRRDVCCGERQTAFSVWTAGKIRSD